MKVKAPEFINRVVKFLYYQIKKHILIPHFRYIPKKSLSQIGDINKG